MYDAIADSLAKIDEMTSNRGERETMKELRILNKYISFLEGTIIDNRLYENYQFIMEEFYQQNNITTGDSQLNSRSGYFKEFDTLEGLIKFIDKYGSIVIIPPNDSDYYTVEIYDDYRE